MMTAALFYRSHYFFDTTWDGMVYELPRIAFWTHFKSVFVLQATEEVSLFANEWNGELNALYYSLLTANDQAISFGNVEVWGIGVLVFTWLARLSGITRELALPLGLYIASTPVLLGLSTVAKGDLLACISFALAIGFIIQLLKNPSSKLLLILSASSLGLSVGSKIVVLVSVVTLLNSC
jgi:hypothetical protein